MLLKKVVKLLAVVAVLGISVAQAGANDYGIFGGGQPPAVKGQNK